MQYTRVNKAIKSREHFISFPTPNCMFGPIKPSCKAVFSSAGSRVGAILIRRPVIKCTRDLPMLCSDTSILAGVSTDSLHEGHQRKRLFYTTVQLGHSRASLHDRLRIDFRGSSWLRRFQRPLLFRTTYEP